MKILETQINIQKPIFQGKSVNITAEQILKLRELGKSEKEISEMLGLKLRTYYTRLKQLNISTRLRDTEYNVIKENNSIALKEKLQELINDKKPVREICNTLKISKRKYFKLIQDFDIDTDYILSKKHIAQITKEMIEELLKAGKSHEEISKILHISKTSVGDLIIKFKIQTNYLKSKQKIAEITKETLEELINQGKKPEEICKELDIERSTYNRLLTVFDIMTKVKQSRANIQSITQKQLQDLVDKGFTPKEICRKLKLSNTALFYKLLKRLHIKYNYQHHSTEINIPREKLEKVVKDWTSQADVEDKLGITSATFYEKAKEAKVTTVLGDSIKKINSLNPKEIQEFLDKGASPEEVCDRFGISKNMYRAVLRKFNLVSKAKKSHSKSQQITKEVLENMINAGMTTMDICKKFKITTGTYVRKLIQFDLRDKK